MWMQLFGCMGGTYVPATEPTVASVTVSVFNGGSCSGTRVGTNATVRATYAINNANYALYTVKVYKDNVLRQSLTGAGTTHDDYTAPGVYGDPHHTTNVNYIWRVDVMRNADSAVISTKTATTFSGSFGDCNGPA